MKLVIDANIFISALMKKDGTAREIIVNSGDIIFLPEYEFQEIYKYKDDIIKKTGYSEKEFIRLTTLLLKNMRIVSYEEIWDVYDEACRIMEKIDAGDIIYIATALAFDAFIWSDDKHFKKQSRIKVLTTEEMIEFSKNGTGQN